MTDLLYASREKAARFRNGIASSMSVLGYHAHQMNHLSYRDFPILEEMEGVVFIGPQTSVNNPREAVFSSHNEYWGFLARAHESGLLVAAVLTDLVKLPSNNAEIDFVLKSDRTMTIRSIAERLAGEF